MNKTRSLLQAGVLGLSLLATGVMAAVSADEAAKLGTTLTPMGAEKAGNADGSIGPWQPLSKTAGSVDAIAEGVREVLDTPPERLADMGARGRAAVLERHDVSVTGAALHALLEQYVA